jgi:hypothetical protein
MRDDPNRAKSEPLPAQNPKNPEVDEDIKIHDYSELPDYDKKCGLSDEQVSRIASDILQTPSYHYSLRSARRS